MKSFLGNFYRHLAIFSGHTEGGLKNNNKGLNSGKKSKRDLLIVPYISKKIVQRLRLLTSRSIPVRRRRQWFEWSGSTHVLSCRPVPYRTRTTEKARPASRQSRCRCCCCRCRDGRGCFVTTSTHRPSHWLNTYAYILHSRSSHNNKRERGHLFLAGKTIDLCGFHGFVCCKNAKNSGKKICLRRKRLNNWK